MRVKCSLLASMARRASPLGRTASAGPFRFIDGGERRISQIRRDAKCVDAGPCSWRLSGSIHPKVSRSGPIRPQASRSVDRSTRRLLDPWTGPPEGFSIRLDGSGEPAAAARQDSRGKANFLWKSCRLIHSFPRIIHRPCGPGPPHTRFPVGQKGSRRCVGPLQQTVRGIKASPPDRARTRITPPRRRTPRLPHPIRIGVPTSESPPTFAGANRDSAARSKWLPQRRGRSAQRPEAAIRPRPYENLSSLRVRGIAPLSGRDRIQGGLGPASRGGFLLPRSALSSK